MTAEQTLEFNRYIPLWQDKKRAQVVEEIASWSLESKRITDPYYFLISPEGDLISPETGIKVREVVGRQRWSYVLGEVEYQAFCQIERIVKEGQFQSIAWISPAYKGIYNENKVVISQVIEQGNQRVLFNKAMIFDEDLGFDEEMRGNPIPFNTEEIYDLPEVWQPKLAALQSAQILYQDLVSSERLGIDPKLMMVKMESLGLVGEYGSSCPTVAGTILESFLGYWRRGNCSKCFKIDTEVGPCQWCKDCERLDNLKKVNYN